MGIADVYIHVDNEVAANAVGEDGGHVEDASSVMSEKISISSQQVNPSLPEIYFKMWIILIVVTYRNQLLLKLLKLSVRVQICLEGAQMSLKSCLQDRKKIKISRSCNSNNR